VLEQIRTRKRESGIPLIGLADERAEIGPEIAARYDACHFKSNRQAILDSIGRLLAHHDQAAHGAPTDRPAMA